MDFDDKIDNLFTKSAEPKKKYNPCQSNNELIKTNNELMKIEQQLNLHLLKKKGPYKYKKVTISKPYDNLCYNQENMDKLSHIEIENNVKTKNWNTLPKFLKWTIIKNYLEKHNINDPRITKHLRHLITNNNKLIGIVYDISLREITQIPSTYLKSS